MPSFSDLPDSVILKILETLAKIDIPPYMSTRSWIEQGDFEKMKLDQRIRTITRSRLVCRQWADWLYQHHLYDMLSFRRSGQVVAFLNEIERRSATLPLPRCRYLKVGDLWTWRTPTTSWGYTAFHDLDTLVDLFSGTIVALDIQAVNFFTLPKASIDRIGGIPNLRMLRLGIRFTKQYRTSHKGVSFDAGSIPDGMPTDSQCLAYLLRAARSVTLLDLSNFRPVCSPTMLRASPREDHLTTITTLKIEVNLGGDITRDEMGSLATKLPNLKKLFIGGLGNDGRLLRPLFESISKQLEEIFVIDARILRPILDFKFPKLRVLRIHKLMNNYSCFYHHSGFSRAPLEVFEVHCHSFRDTGDFMWPYEIRKFLQGMPYLKRIVFHDAGSYGPPSSVQKLCQDKGVECVLLPHHNPEDGLPAVALPSNPANQKHYMCLLDHLLSM